MNVFGSAFSVRHRMPLPFLLFAGLSPCLCLSCKLGLPSFFIGDGRKLSAFGGGLVSGNKEIASFHHAKAIVGLSCTYSTIHLGLLLRYVLPVCSDVLSLRGAADKRNTDEY
jgi:hypothetical protein